MTYLFKNSILKYFFKFLSINCVVFLCLSFTQDNSKIIVPYQNDVIDSWADSLMNTLSLEEKIGQLFMVAANGKNLDADYHNKVDSLISNYHIGGVIFFQSGPNELRKLLNRYNNISSMPLLTSLDAEWGLGMRLDSVQDFPWMITLGAIQDVSIIRDFGKEVARQLKLLGIHMNFAPVIDINNNPNNPIIDRRSFGSEVNLVNSRGLAYMDGLQSNNILACAKHFPGHGDTDVDSHKALPVLHYSRSRLDSIELSPFNHLIRHGLGSVMIAHMNLPLIDTLGVPSSFSSNIIRGILKDDMHFNGLVVSDALNMGALSEYANPGEIELNAFLAGNDILLCPDNILESIKLIKYTVENNTVFMNYLNQSCKKIIMIKKWAGAFDKKNSNDTSELINQESELLSKELSKQAITVLKNHDNILPLVNLDSLKLAYVSIGDDVGDVFYNRLNNYVPINKYIHQANSISLLKELKQYDLIILGAHYINNNFWDKHVVSFSDSVFVSKLCAQNNTVLNIFGHPKVLNSFSFDALDALVLSYQNSFVSQELTAQLIFGSISASGRLPVSTNNFSSGDGIVMNSMRDFEFVLPIEIGANNDSLSKIDSLINTSIKEKVLPGCQIVVARHGKIFYNKAFGYHTYDSIRPVLDVDLYDIASITKIVSAAPIFMHLVDNKSLKLYRKLKNYMSLSPDYVDKKNIKIIDILTHQAKLFPWIPFWKYFQDDHKLDQSIFSNSFSNEYDMKIVDSLYFNSSYLDTIHDIILSYPLLDVKEYKYSDLGFYIMHPVVKNLLDSEIDKYVYENFYYPVDAYRITYNPADKFPLSSIVPTENDTYFRNQLIHGYVHDQGAAFFRGVGLHAGLFSNAIDLMKFMNLYLQEGVYMNKDVLPKRRIREFTTSPFYANNNRRGIIFDKPSIDPEELGPTCDSISLSSFGHSGFTGTLAWADPDKDLIYIFLSNARVFPNGNNTKLIERNIRTEIQSIIYNSLN